MPKATSNIAPVSAYHNLASGDLVDQHGRIGVEIAELEARHKAIAAEIIGRGVSHADGALFTTTVVMETTTTTVDRKAIERDMGEFWLAKYLKWSKRCASVRTAPRAAAVAQLAA